MINWHGADSIIFALVQEPTPDAIVASKLSKCRSWMPGSRSSDQEHYRPDVRKEDLGRWISQWLGWGTLAADRFREAPPANLPQSWLGWPDRCR